jgi:predicted aspartyl protease
MTRSRRIESFPKQLSGRTTSPGLLCCSFAFSILVAGTLWAQSPEGDSLFAHGRLNEAEAAYARRLAADPSDRAARKHLGLLALWRNHLARADSLLPDDEDEARGEILYRQKRYLEASPRYRRLGRGTMAAKLAALTDPYETSMSGERAVLPFARGAVLPVVHVTVNGREGDFLIDTGAGETIMDVEFAAAIGARTFGADSGVYAAGRRATFEHGVVGSIVLGSATIRNVPVHIQRTRAYAPAAGGRAVSGIIGVGLLSQFHSTMDFAGAQLVLERRGGPRGDGVSIPFWLLGDHFVTISATAVDSVEVLLVFDTGLAMPGGALVPAASLVAEAGVTLGGGAVSGVGGGGRVQVTPFQFPGLRVGPLQRDSVLAVAGAFPPTLERRFGPRIGGLLSHGFFSDRRVTLDFEAMQLVVSEPIAAPARDSSPRPASALPESIEQRARLVIDLLRAKDYEGLARLWSPDLLQRLPPAKLGETWQGLVGAVGEVTEVGSVVVERSGDGRQDARVPVRFGRTPLTVALTFDRERHVVGVRMQ